MADGETAATAYTIGWEPQPGPQTALLACPVFEVFFGGARGGGKTDGMLGEWASHADLHGKNAVGLMVRRERVQLLETIERSRQLYAPIGARYNDQDKMWRWPNGARLRFAYLERDADADAYQGHSYTRVYVEELGTFPSASPVLRLMATLRSGEGVRCGFRATGNPGGPGHQWVKARYIDPNPAGWEIRKFTYENPWTRETIEQDRVFIPSKLQDNKFLGHAEAVGAGITQRESRDPNLRYGVLDPACFKEDGRPSIAERINKELIAARLRPFHAADNSRVPHRGSMGGWDQLRSRLVGQDGRPMIYCFSTHADSIRTIPALQHDPARPEDGNTESEDHAADEWRYACMSRPFVRVPVARTRSAPDVGYVAYRSPAPGDWKLY